jgi:hypothetical protein
VEFGQQAEAAVHPRTTQHVVQVGMGEQQPYRGQPVGRQPIFQFALFVGIRTARVHQQSLSAVVQYPGVLIERIEGETGDAQNGRK